MRMQATSAPTALPLTLTEAKRQLRIEESETAHDADITALVKAASEWVFATCHITLITTGYQLTFAEFPEKQFRIPGYPIQEIITLEYRDETGALQEITDYQLDMVQVPASFYPAPGKEWPATQQDRIDAVVVTMTAGYGSVSANIPEMVKHLIRLLVAHWFRNREAVLIGVASKEIELAADNLMKQIRVNEFESFTP